MGLNNVPELKAIIFKGRKDFYKASDAIFRECRRRVSIGSQEDKKVEVPDYVAALQGERKGFYNVLMLFPAAYKPCIENLKIDYKFLGKEEAKKFIQKEDTEFLSKNGSELEKICD